MSYNLEHCKVETVQDFLIKFDMKPCMLLVEIHKQFFTKFSYCQTYQNYEQSRQKLATILGTKVHIFESTNFEVFEEVVHNFGKSDDDMI